MKQIPYIITYRRKVKGAQGQERVTLLLSPFLILQWLHSNGHMSFGKSIIGKKMKLPKLAQGGRVGRAWV